MNCLYCQLNSGTSESEHLIRFFESPNIMLYLHRDQTLPGRFVIATRMHFEDVTEMPEDIYIEFCSLARHLGRLVKKAFPDTVKINWALCGNVSEARHPHLHILPRHVGDRHWPAFFLDYVQPYWPLEDPRYKMTINALTVLPAKI